MYQRNRSKRYTKLIQAGFRPYEAKWLSLIPFKGHPGMLAIIQRRRKLQEKRLREANKKSWSQAKRSRVWNARTRKMYHRRRWIAYSDHPTGAGPSAGEPDPFSLYRFYERNVIMPLPGDSKKPDTHGRGGGKHWTLDQAQMLLFRARYAWRHSDFDKYQAAVAELDSIISHSSGKKKQFLRQPEINCSGARDENQGLQNPQRPGKRDCDQELAGVRARRL